MYRAKRNFICNNKRVKVGDKVDFGKRENKKLMANDCIYSTKEEKRVYDRTTKAIKIEKGSGWYEIRKGNQVIDKVRGEEKAQALVEEIND